jgi:CheY-like chemotaxis protein
MTTSTANRTPKALLLDDDTTVLRLVGTALEARGFEVRAAIDGEAGLALLVDELLALDVVLVDADLPGRDARALLHLVRWAGGERELGVVVLCGALDDAAKDELLRQDEAQRRILANHTSPQDAGKVFDRVWQITFLKGKPTLADLPQMLLYGDSDK